MVLLAVFIIILVVGSAILFISIPSSPQPRSTSRPIIAPQPTSTPQQKQIENPEPFTGVERMARLDWEIDGLLYIAIIQTFGLTGVVDVTYFDQSVGADVVVTQDLILQEFEDVWVYVGTNPRYAGTGVPASYSCAQHGR
jgi:hypothetical protein